MNPPTHDRTIRDQITAAICEVFHPGANHDQPQLTCTKAAQAADIVLRAVSEYLTNAIQPTDRGFVRADDPETTKFMLDCLGTIEVTR